MVPWRCAAAAPYTRGVARGDGMLTHDLDPRREAAAGRLRGLRGLGPRRRGRQAHLLRPLRAAAPWPGGRRHRGQRRRRRVRGLQGPRPGLAGVRRGDARHPAGHIAVGHTRYSTTGSTTWENAQPTFRTTRAGTGLALGHNGNLVNTADLARRGRARRASAATGSAPPPTPTWSPRCSRPARTCRVEQAAMEVLPTLRGAFSLRLHGRAHPLRRARPAGCAAARPRPARTRLGGHVRDRRAGHRRRAASCARSSPAS